MKGGIALLLVLLAHSSFSDDPPWLVRGREGMVASDSKEASGAGVEILRAGGNAFDAAIAASLTIGVTRPESTGIGGGGFMVAYIAAENRFVALDFRETAPRGATPERYAELRRQAGDGPSPSIFGGNAVGVPGLAAGYAEIARRFGTRPIRELVAPALRLAREGFAADEFYVGCLESALRKFERTPDFRQRFAAFYRTQLISGRAPKPGETVRRLDLARTLTEIEERGPEAFYAGEIAAEIIQAVQAAGGTMTLEDLGGYRVRERTPLRFSYRGHEIATMPPPSSGGTCIAQILGILQARSDWSLSTQEPLRSHLLIEAMKHAFADRARWLGDPDFASLTTDRLVSSDYAAELARRIRPDGVLPDREDYGTRANGSQAAAPADRGTTHFCVADRFGNVVAFTETINGTYGSLVVTESTGIILNNEMDDFTTVPGEANLFGLVQGEANLVAPGKRPLSSMSPTIVMQSGRPVLVLGGSGGPRIITAVLALMLHGIDRGLSLEKAMTESRLHHQWRPDDLAASPPLAEDVAKGLKALGHQISGDDGAGAVTAIQFLPNGSMVGASEPRRLGRPGAVR